MILRPRQQQAVDRIMSALGERGNTLLVAPTGAGKTVMLNHVVKESRVKRALVLQHRDELVAQNRAAYHKVNPKGRSGVIDASGKTYDEPVTFAMVQTLTRDTTLAALPKQDLIVVDECHHAVARSWAKIIDAVRTQNPDAKLLGVTATPARGDKKGLRGLFDNVSDQIRIGELIAAGNLVRPRTYVVDIGVQGELRDVRKTVEDFDMQAVAAIMDKDVLNEAVVKHWTEKASGRRTVVFASTVAHAEHTCEAFKAAGVTCAVVHGDMGEADRRNTLSALANGSIQVICNVAVLTEGWDCPPVSCVVLLRPSSYKSTMIQMIGRGLRPVDPERYPSVDKHDCIVLDFGISTLTHGSLEQDVVLDDRDGGGGEAPTKLCPDCNARVPIAVMECAVCGYEFPPAIDPGEQKGLADFVMTEIDILDASPFKWEDLWNDATCLIAAAFESWAVVINFRGQWRAIGASAANGIHNVAVGDKLLCLAQADDFLRQNTDGDEARKSKRWLKLPATEKQLEHLGMTQLQGLTLTRYQAACRLTWKFSERAIKAKLLA